MASRDLEDRVERLVENNTPALLAYFLRRTTDPADAADLLGDALLVIWRRAKALPTDDSEARLWMFGVARRVLASQRRGQQRRSALQDRLRAQLTVTGGAPDTDRIDLEVALRRLSAVDQEIIRLVHWDGFSQAEAAQLLGLPEGTLRSRHHRARQQLRGMLQGFTSPR
jgi:RNA polymerase sigma-70 factor (ECF subfamily)